MSDPVPNLALYLVDLVLSGVLLLLVARTATWLLRRGSASLREIVWTATFLALLALPVTESVAPALEISAGWISEPIASVLAPVSASSGRT